VKVIYLTNHQKRNCEVVEIGISSKMINNKINIAILGDAGVGKTCFVRALKMIHHEKKYISTVGCELHPIPVHDIIVNVWDFGGQDKYKSYALENLSNMDHVLIMYEKNNRLTKKNAETKWKDMIGDNPHTFVMTKCDDDATGISAKDRPEGCIDLLSEITQKY